MGGTQFASASQATSPTQPPSTGAKRSLTHATPALAVRMRSASGMVTTPTASAHLGTRVTPSFSARRLSARFVITDPSAVVPKVTQGIHSQLASVVLWSEQNSRGQKQNQGAS